MNGLRQEISFLEEKVADGKQAADKLSVLEDELNKVHQAHSEQKKCQEVLEKKLSLITEIKCNLENTIVEKNVLISSLESNIKEITDKMKSESENQVSEREYFQIEEKRLKDLLEEFKQKETATKIELRSHREEIKTMKTTLFAASSGLQERDSVIKNLNEKLKTIEAEKIKTAELLKEKMDAMNKIKVCPATALFYYNVSLS